MTQIKQMCSVPSDGKLWGGGGGDWGKEAKTFENYKTAGAAWDDLILMLELWF